MIPLVKTPCHKHKITNSIINDVTRVFQLVCCYGPAIDSASNRNECQTHVLQLASTYTESLMACSGIASVYFDYRTNQNDTSVHTLGLISAFSYSIHFYAHSVSLVSIFLLRESHILDQGSSLIRVVTWPCIRGSSA